MNDIEILDVYENNGKKIFSEKNIIIEDEYKVRKSTDKTKINYETYDICHLEKKEE